MRTRWIALFAATPLFAQPAFEVASIKPWSSHEIGGVYTHRGGRVTFRGCTLEYLIEQAFNIQRFQISGGPAWMDADRFDIDAKPPDSSPSSRSMPPYPKAPMNEEQRQMLQSLLIDRFRLQYRSEAREAPVYLLSKGTKPLRWTDSKDKNDYPWSRVSGEGLEAINENMPDLAWRLSQTLDRPVLDRTGISGSFDFQIPYRSEDLRPDLVAATLATIHDLGLKLDSSRAPVTTLWIDRADKPTAN
jgi:uncharacterized protein (TIGR03435 family)